MVELKEYLIVDSTSCTGLRWIKYPGGSAKAGREAFTAISGAGYYHGTFRGISYQAHRVVFYLTQGYWPIQVDRIDGNKLNNVSDNIRGLSIGDNSHNKLTKGYYYVPTINKWCARICADGVRTTLGYFVSEEEAHAAYLAAKKYIHPTAPARCYA